MTAQTIETFFKAADNFDLNISLLEANKEIHGIKRDRAIKIKRLTQSIDFSKIVTERKWQHFFADSPEIDYIEEDFFVDFWENRLEKYNFLAGKVLLISNVPCQFHRNTSNNKAALYEAMNAYVAACSMLSNTLLLVWDWDNHHNLFISAMLALFSDMYFPSHEALEYELSEATDILRHMPATSHQWPRKFMASHLEVLLKQPRAFEVYGRYTRYGKFKNRNDLIDVLSTRYSGIGYVADIGEYWKKSGKDRLLEWCSIKSHWIVPTLNDISTRIFDSLMTGGVIIIPRKFLSKPVIQTLDMSDFVVYDYMDLQNPDPIVKEAVRKFDEGGPEGIVRRHRFALDRHNLDIRFQEIIDYAKLMLNKTSRL